MSADIVLFVLGGLALVLVLVMDGLGILGVFGGLRFTACERCDRWTVHTLKAKRLICHRCRRIAVVPEPISIARRISR